MNRIFVLSLIQRHEPKRTLNMNWSTLVKPLIWTTFPPSLLPLAKNHYVELDPMAQTHKDIEHSSEAPNSDHFSSQPPLLPLPEDHWHNDIIHTFAPSDEPMTTNDVNRDPLDDYMYFRFRFTSPPIEQSSQPSSKEWREIC